MSKYTKPCPKCRGSLHTCRTKCGPDCRDDCAGGSHPVEYGCSECNITGKVAISASEAIELAKARQARLEYEINRDKDQVAYLRLRIKLVTGEFKKCSKLISNAMKEKSQ